MMNDRAVIKDSLDSMVSLMRGKLGPSQIICYITCLIFSQWYARHTITNKKKVYISIDLFENDDSSIEGEDLPLQKIAHWEKVSFDEFKNFLQNLEYKFPEISEALHIVQNESRLNSEPIFPSYVFKDLGQLARQALDASEGFLSLDLFNELLNEGANALALDYIAPNFNTPESVCSLVAKIIKVEAGEKVCDPCMGSGKFLLQSISYLRTNNIEISGCEDNKVAWALAKLNAILQGYPSSKISQRNFFEVLDTDNNEKFDVVVSNPPWSVKFTSRSKWIADKFDLPHRGYADYAFVLQMLSQLRGPQGRMAIVLSNGALSRSGAEYQIRQKLCENGLIDAVIALPERLFENTNVPATILVFRKTENYSNKVLFIDARSMARSSKKANFLPNAAIENISNLYDKRREEPGISKLVGMEELASHDYSLHASRYVQVELHEERQTLMEVTYEIARFEEELVRIEAQIDEELGSLLT